MFSIRCRVLKEGWKGGERRREERREDGAAYKWRAHRHRAPLVPRLHDGRVDAGDGVRQAVEVAGEETVGGEVFVEDVEELHQAGGDVFGLGQVRGQRQARLDGAEQPR